MQPRLFAIVSALLIGILGVTAVSVTEWTPAAEPVAAAPAAPSPSPSPSASADPVVWTRATLGAKLMSEMEATDPGVALADLDKITKELPYTVRFCHPIAHELGHAAVQRYNQDFQKVISFPHDTCAAGYLHGAVEQMLADANDPQQKILSLCAPGNALPCIHGIGHGTMFVTKQDIAGARDLCNKFPGNTFRVTCSEGLFMQLFAPDEEDANAKANLPADKLATEPFYPCPEQPALFQSACYFYAPTYYLSSHQYAEHPEVFAAALKWCLQAGSGANDCSRGVGSRTMKYNLDREDWAAQQCATAADAWQRRACTQGLMSYYKVNYTDKGAPGRLCAKITNKEIEGYCRSAGGLSATVD